MHLPGDVSDLISLYVEPLSTDTFYIEASLLYYPVNEGLTDRKSVEFEIFSAAFEKYLEEKYQQKPLRENSSIIIEVEKISKLFKNGEESEDEIEISFTMRTNNFFIDHEHAKLVVENRRNDFDLIFDVFDTYEFSKIMGDGMDFYDDGQHPRENFEKYELSFNGKNLLIYLVK